MVHLGVFNVWRPKDPDEAIMIHLKIIETKLVRHEQFALFKRRVLQLIHKGRTEQVRVIVAEVATVISTLGQVLLGDSSTHGLRDAQVEILKNGWRNLGALRPIMRDETEELAAIDNDTASFQTAVSLVLPPQQSGNVLVYYMTNPETPPVNVLPGLSTCRDVKRYLISAKKADHPELWARQHIRQQHIPSALRWKWLPLSYQIHGIRLEFVDRTDPNYIVVLKYENEEGLPEPIALARTGDPCCPEKCGNLQAHLGSLWPKRIVAQALRIKDGASVLTETFDANLFDWRTNDLFVHLVCKD